MISVVIPLYNKEKSIAGTIQSVLNQTYKNFELIIVNDGSTDKSADVVQSIKDERIKLINKKNGGVSSARNKGIEASSYDYIAFIDGDDIWLSEHLQIIWNMINQFNDDNIGGFCTRIMKSRNVNNFSVHSHEIKPSILVDNYLQLASGADSVLSSSSFAIKKSCFSNIGMFNEKLSFGEDVELWYRLFKKYKLVLNNTVTARYLLFAENRSDKKITPLEKRFHNFDFDNKPECEKRYLGKLVALVILDYAMQGAYKISFKIFWRYKKQTRYIISYFLQLTKKRTGRNFKSS
jgi:glycosyltransferase involved in cell wall biosynthesis